MSKERIVVLKFGSSVLQSESDLPSVVHEIYRWWRQGNQVVAVVSAFGTTTDDLTRRAHQVCGEPDETLLAALLATGEAASSALLGLALNRSGIPAAVLDAEQAGLTTIGRKVDADLTSVDTVKLLAALRRGVVVLPGFVGRSESGETTLLGRGGSDLTALFIAQRLGGRCLLIKDVDGLYTSDPNARNGRVARRYIQASYDTAGKVGGAVVQLKAINFAEGNRLRFEVSSIGSTNTTEIGPFADQVSVGEKPIKPLRVALLGCGTVGAGVYHRLAALPELFQLVGVGTRNVDRAIHEDIPVRLITTHLDALIQEPVDVVIELLGGIEPARSLITKSLQLGRAVVTANKALLSTEVNELETLASLHGSSISFSAAVCGVAPALETVKNIRATGPISRVTGVLNGTTNFVLDEVANGVSLSEAIKSAQARGYAEANPQFDLDGTDAAQKLILIAREAFGVDLEFGEIRRDGIENVSTNSSRTVRLLADCRRTETGLEASVGPVELDSDHPLASVTGVGNRLLIHSVNGRVWSVSGHGAGRWPTAEAIVADLIDLRTESVAAAIEEEECVA